MCNEPNPDRIAFKAQTRHNAEQTERSALTLVSGVGSTLGKPAVGEEKGSIRRDPESRVANVE